MAGLTVRDTHHVQLRGWGFEEWIENCPEYCGKLLHVYPGRRCSLHFHMLKKETMLVTHGSMTLVSVDPTTGVESGQVVLGGQSVLIEPGRVHQIWNHSDDTELVLVEFSTTHAESDSYRVRKGD